MVMLFFIVSEIVKVFICGVKCDNKFRNIFDSNSINIIGLVRIKVF